LNPRLLQILVCPICKVALKHDRANSELVCDIDELAFPIRDDIPVMLVNEARRFGSVATAPQTDATNINKSNQE
jgi:uncharacterized protein